MKNKKINKMKLIKTTEVMSLMSGVLTPQETTCLQHQKKNLNIQHLVHLKKVSDDKVFTSKLVRPK